jgi:hypothetical protein
MFGVLFLSISYFFVSSHRCLDDSFFTNFQDIKAKDFEYLGERGKCP